MSVNQGRNCHQNSKETHVIAIERNSESQIRPIVLTQIGGPHKCFLSELKRIWKELEHRK